MKSNFQYTIAKGKYRQICLVLFFLFPAFVLKSFGQLKQVGTINIREVLKAEPALPRIDSLVEKEVKRYQKQYTEKRELYEYQVKQADSIRKQENADKGVLDMMIAKVNRLNAELVALEQQANKSVAEYRQVLQKPYLDRIDAIIKRIAKKHTFSHVLSDSENGLVYSDPAYDITAEVIKEMKAL